MDALLSPIEELALDIIKEEWEKRRRKISIMELKNLLETRGYKYSHEKVRHIVEELWRKGEILIDVKGRERLVRPNHVTINSRIHPLDYRNFTILDKDGKPIQRIWISIYRTKKGDLYFSISESKWNGEWKTVNNIIIPPSAKKEFKKMIEFLSKYLEQDPKTGN